ncbi:MAG: sulfatase-like hydrolase/transferase [Bacteroidota bacterium]
MSFRRSILALSFLPLFVFVLDLILRFNYLRLLELPLFQHFLYSFIFEWTICFTAVWIVSQFHHRRKTVTAIAVAILTVIQLIAYGHYFYFGVLPNPYSVNYLLDHTADALSLIGSSVTWIQGAVFAFLFLLQYVIFTKALRGMDQLSSRFRFSIIGIFFLLIIVFNNNVRFAPASYSITPATVFSIKYALQERWFGSSFEVRHGYVRRRFTIEERPQMKAQYNCILILSESVRSRSLSSYGYRRPTTPFQDSMIAAGSIIKFDHHFTNTVSTQYTIPVLLSGVFTIRKTDQPFIYDYLKHWSDVKTYFFSSQSMQRSNIDLVYNTSLDTFLCQEKLTLPQFNDLGVDDEEFAGMVRSFHEKQSGEKFFSIIQFNNTHFPYTVKPSAEYFTSTPDSAVVDLYDNTIREQDGLLRSYINSFRRAGLLDSTVIIFTSDHGEAFGERGHLGHLNTLYTEDVEVPLWIYLPPGFPKEKRDALRQNSKAVTSHLDLFPTMMDLFGLNKKNDPGMKFCGVSLFQSVGRNRIIPIVGKDMIDTKAVVIDSIKYIETVKDGIAKYEAYDFRTDAGERNNIWQRLTAAEQKSIKQYILEVDTISMQSTQH